MTFWLFVVSTAAIVAGLLCASFRYGTLAFEAEMGRGRPAVDVIDRAAIILLSVGVVLLLGALLSAAWSRWRNRHRS
ncbi:hypothetical protein [Georgenia sp. AZ-5]|uniref:hypothetical protein n=1 Tax=Georgenia sp. AZ-5 TaxID=3367526 RepID=UPI003754EDEF